ncbi:MAG: TrkA family potassium uptake protein [Planctomycetaceae bacterium]
MTDTDYPIEEYGNELPFRRLLKAAYFLLGVLLLGTFGYMVVEGWGFADSFYMTVITVSTVGYGETNTLSPDGRAFTSGLIFLSLVSMTGWSAVLTSFLVESDLSGNFQRRKTARMISQLKGHTIVCGTGLMAQAVIERLARKRTDVVVIDSDAEALDTLKKRFRRLLVLEGEGTNEMNLAKANVLEASHVVAATDSETDNLLIGITCKDMGPNLTVIARSNNISIANRMRKSGIDEVISPSQLGGERVTDLILG